MIAPRDIALRVAAQSDRGAYVEFGPDLLQPRRRRLRGNRKSAHVDSGIDAPLADRTALFLDVDGTLLDLAASPTAVVVPHGLVECIADIERSLGGALALVTGRTLADLDRLFLPLRLRASGVHGAEIRYDPRAPVIVDAAAAALPARLWRSLNASSRGFSRRVRGRQALQFRGALQSGAERGWTCARFCGGSIAAEAIDEVEFIDAHFAFEIKGRGFDKG